METKKINLIHIQYRYIKNNQEWKILVKQISKDNTRYKYLGWKRLVLVEKFHKSKIKYLILKHSYRN